MCGRYVLWADSPELFEDEFSQSRMPIRFDVEIRPNWNASPTQILPVIVEDDDGYVVQGMRWGLMPFWATPGKVKPQINARSETAAEKPMFRSAFKSRRAIVPGSGFYEWKKVGTEKVPHYIHLASDKPMWLAGLWESSDKFEDPKESFTILTTAANQQMSELHDRMPVILDPGDFAEWLSRDEDIAPLERLLRPLPEGMLDIYRVSSKVNSPRNNDPSNIEPVDEAA